MVQAPKKAVLELNAIFENATVGILFTKHRRLTQANRLCAGMFGYELDEFLGQSALILYADDEAYSALGRVAGPVLSEGKPFRAEVQLKRRDGSLFWCRVSAKAVDPERPRDGTLWIIEDMTDDHRMLEALERSTRELTAILDTASIGIAVVRNREFVRCNRRFEELFDLEAGSLVGSSARVLFDSDEEYERIGQQVYAEFAAGRVHHREQLHRRSDGGLSWLRVSGSVFDATTPHAGSVWLTEDVTATRAAEARARQAYDEQQIIFDNAAVGILFASDRMVRRCNRRLAEIFGYEPEELAGRSTRVFFLGEEDYQNHGAVAFPPILAGGTHVAETRVRHKDGHAFWVRVTGRQVAGTNDSVDLIWIFEDVTERHQAEEALLRAHDELEQRVVERTAELASANTQLQEEVFERMQAEQRIWQVAHHDSLTGLPNRALLHDRLEQALAKAQRSRNRVAVMFLDLDRFKSVNDTLGHAVGDELLKYVAARLTGVVRAVDTVSRLGGDEFVIVLHEASSSDDVAQVAEKILDALSPEVNIGGHPLRATPSIGISIYPDDGDEVFALMKNADTAMYHAKAAGRNNYQFFARKMNEQAAHFFKLESRLRHAIDSGALLLHYQPLIDWPRRAVCGMEALARWKDAEDGLIAPADFVPIAEETGLIVPVGEWVLAAALRQNRLWQQHGRPLLPVSVNLSPRQFRQKDLVGTLRRILADTGQPARLLELEITESTLMHDIEETQARLQEIAAMGVRLVIDDFGTGYSSLAYLKRFPVHKLKVDQGFVRELTHDPEDAAIVTAIIGLARSLALDIVAEGVETRAQLDALLGLGCEKFQGYLFARPQPPINADDIFRPRLPAVTQA
ncbi:EAL domain-containing protein [Sulfuritalea sp.]|uniref:sensor domain-containing protein n=1 Tax=Sulfuritalea sp. TaxID=2480090 RepID=UPI001AC379E6|nr:EAL domain-containing protein [Sulfuritalea sp.]MBN8474982.1 EAL domain-containing protein [Sulfuritalea sp.]